MKYPLLRSLLSLGTIFLVCSCSDDKPSSSHNDDDSIIPCEDAWYLPTEHFLIIPSTLKVINTSGQQVGTIVPVPGTNYVIVKDMAGQNLIDQLNINNQDSVKYLAGNPENCNVKAPIAQPGIAISSCEDAWYYHPAEGNDFLIYSDLSVTTEDLSIAGSIVPIPNTTLVNMMDTKGNLLYSNINLAELSLVKGDGIRYKILEPAYHLKDATGNYLIYPNTVTTDPSGTPIAFADFATNSITSLDKSTTITTANFATLPILTPNAKCVDYTPVVSSSSSIKPPQPSSSSSSNSVPPSSSSKPKSSSSSSVKSSSSKTVVGGCPTIKTKGNSGKGWATRYWDCCKPHCSWPENSHGNFSRQCTNKGTSESTDWSGGSICSGGGLMTCTSQIPFTIDGCTEMGFAFAAVPAANGGDCGKCYQLTFTGKGKYSTDANHTAIKGKKLIIMVTNIGTDVEQEGQFDIMIPGGGVGMFNGCSSMGWGPQGEQYGGLLSDCEKSSNYKPAKTLTCLQDKCNSVFSNDSKAKQGCLFLAGFMHAAGNPLHDYVEVECPEVLKAKY